MAPNTNANIIQISMMIVIDTMTNTKTSTKRDSVLLPHARGKQRNECITNDDAVAVGAAAATSPRLQALEHEAPSWPRMHSLVRSHGLMSSSHDGVVSGLRLYSLTKHSIYTQASAILSHVKQLNERMNGWMDGWMVEQQRRQR